MIFNGMVMTNAGKIMLARSLTEDLPIVIDTFAWGDGYIPAGETRLTLNALVSTKKTGAITDKSYQSDGTVILEARLTSAQITEEFYIREWGCLAHTGDNNRILFAYDNIADDADKMPVGGGSGFVEQVFKTTIAIGNAENIEIRLGTGGLGGGEAYWRQFAEADWEPVGPDYRLMIPELEHDRGLNAAVGSILREEGSYYENVRASWRQYVNGDIAIISNNAFAGKASVI